LPEAVAEEVDTILVVVAVVDYFKDILAPQLQVNLSLSP
jgi:hypothetical protein